MEQIQGMQQNGETRIGYGEGLDEQLAEWSAELFRDPQYRNTWADAEHGWRLESAARTRLIIKKQLREEIEREMAKELGLPANWRGNKLKSLADWHEKMACLAKADAAPRCEHVFQDGTRCGSPRMKTGELCYAHERMARVRPRKLNLLAMEDANAIMLNIMEINRALVDEEITEKRAGMLLYSQQLGLQTLGKLTFHKAERDRMIREEFEALGRERTRMETNEEARTAKDAKNAKDEERFATDEHGRTQMGEEALAEHGRAPIAEEESELREGGINALSPVNAGMEGRGEDCQNRRNCQRLKIEELTLTPAHEARAGDPGAKDAKNANEEEQDATTKGAEGHGGMRRSETPQPRALSPCPSHDLKDLGGAIPGPSDIAYAG